MGNVESRGKLTFWERIEELERRHDEKEKYEAIEEIKKLRKRVSRLENKLQIFEKVEFDEYSDEDSCEICDNLKSKNFENSRICVKSRKSKIL